MVYSLTHIIQRLKETRVLQNYSYMSVLSITNALIGLLIYPYLIRVMGTNAMGTYVFVLGIVMYFQAVVDFGFDMPAIKAVSLCKDSPKELDRIVSTLYICKVGMFLVALLSTIPIVWFVPLLRAQLPLFCVLFGQLLYSILFPQWYYQGKKDLRFATLLQLAIRLCQVPLIVCLVKGEEDLMTYALIVCGTMLLGGMVGMVNLWHEGRRCVRVTMEDIRTMFRDAFPFFCTSISSTIKDRTLTTLIGVCLGMHEVALYDLALKVVQIPRLIINSINIALFPEVVGHATESLVKRIVRIERWIGIGAMAGVAVLGYPAVWLLGGKEMLEAYPIALVLSVTIYTFLLVGAYLQFVFVAQGRYKIVALNQLVAMVSCLTLCAIGLWLVPSPWVAAAALALSGLLEILFCKTLVHSKVRNDYGM